MSEKQRLAQTPESTVQSESTVVLDPSVAEVFDGKAQPPQGISTSDKIGWHLAQIENLRRGALVEASQAAAAIMTKLDALVDLVKKVDFARKDQCLAQLTNAQNAVKTAHGTMNAYGAR